MWDFDNVIVGVSQVFLFLTSGPTIDQRKGHLIKAINSIFKDWTPIILNSTKLGWTWLKDYSISALHVNLDAVNDAPFFYRSTQCPLYVAKQSLVRIGYFTVIFFQYEHQ